MQKQFGNQGCNGGMMDNAFAYVVANKGLCSEKSYPYYQKESTCQSGHCRIIKESAFLGCVDVTPNNELALNQQLL